MSEIIKPEIPVAIKPRIDEVEVWYLEVPDEIAYCKAFNLSCENLIEMIKGIECEDIDDCVKMLALESGCKEAVIVTHSGDRDWDQVVLCPDEDEKRALEKAEEWAEELDSLLQKVSDIIYEKYNISYPTPDVQKLRRLLRQNEEAEELIELYNMLDECYSDPSSCELGESVEEIKEYIRENYKLDI